MELTRLKQLVALLGAVVAIGGAAALLALAALLIVRTGTGADPADAFSPTEIIPESLRGQVEWLDDDTDLDRAMEPTSREALEAAWLHAAAARELSSVEPATASAHDLRVGFYSLDGQIVTLTAQSQVSRTVAGREIRMSEAHDVVMMLTDGSWEINQLVRTGAILIET